MIFVQRALLSAALFAACVVAPSSARADEPAAPAPTHLVTFARSMTPTDRPEEVIHSQFLGVLDEKNKVVGVAGIVHVAPYGHAWLHVSDATHHFNCAVIQAADGVYFRQIESGRIAALPVDGRAVKTCALPRTLDPRLLRALRTIDSDRVLSPIARALSLWGIHGAHVMSGPDWHSKSWGEVVWEGVRDGTKDGVKVGAAGGGIFGAAFGDTVGAFLGIDKVGAAGGALAGAATGAVGASIVLSVVYTGANAVDKAIDDARMGEMQPRDKPENNGGSVGAGGAASESGGETGGETGGDDGEESWGGEGDGGGGGSGGGEGASGGKGNGGGGEAPPAGCLPTTFENEGQPVDGYECY